MLLILFIGTIYILMLWLSRKMKVAGKSKIVDMILNIISYIALLIAIFTPLGFMPYYILATIVIIANVIFKAVICKKKI